MDIPASALSGALRVGVQVVVDQKRPLLEIYQIVHNEFQPPFEVDTHNSAKTKILRTDKHRFQDIFVDHVLVNVGGIRAENVSFETSGTFRRETPFEKLPKFFETTIKQIAPGQLHYILRIYPHDLNKYAPNTPGNASALTPVGLKTDTLTINVHYEAPATFLNWFHKLWRSIRGLRQYTTTFTFDPALFEGVDLPPAKYNG